jgi:hypothetical protein
MRITVEMRSGVIIYVHSFIKTGSSFQIFYVGSTPTDT